VTRVASAHASVALLWLWSASAGYSQSATEEQQRVQEVVHRFREAMLWQDPESVLKDVLAKDFVYITPAGAMTKSWTFGRGDEFNSLQKLELDQLQSRIFGQFAIASYRLKFVRGTSPSIFRNALQVFRKNETGWKLLVSQIVSFPGLEGPIAATQLTPPDNPRDSERDLRETWEEFLAAVRKTLPGGEPSEDLVTIRRIQAEDCVFVSPNDGTLMGREERLKMGHPGGVGRLSHEDLNIAILGNAAVITSRNQEGGNRSIRLFLKRPSGWQLVTSKQMWYPQSGPVATK
jgi:ketosteroid isomerase-like protein